MEKTEHLKKLKEEFSKLKIEIKDLLNNVNTSRHTHLQNYIYFAHHPVFSFTESIMILCENKKPHVAKVLLRTLFEVHIDIIYHQLGDSEQRLAFLAKRMFDERIIILEEILCLIKKYPNLESENPKELFNKKYLEQAIKDQKTHQEAILRGNPGLKGTNNLQEKAKKCEEGEVKNSVKGHFERMYSMIYRQLSPMAHLNLEGLQSFTGQDEYRKIFFHDGDDGNFVTKEALGICLAFTQDLYENRILTGKPISTIENLEKLISA